MRDAGEPDARFRVWLDESNNIVRCQWSPGADGTLELATKITSEVAAITTVRPLPLLVDLRELKSISKDARTHFAAVGGGATAVALLGQSAVSRMVANFFIGTSRPSYPVRMFTSERDALAWLEQQ